VTLLEMTVLVTVMMIMVTMMMVVMLTVKQTSTQGPHGHDFLRFNKTSLQT